MKTIINKYFLIVASVFAIIVSGCKEKEDKFVSDLALNRDKIVVGSEEGTTRVVVYSNRSWEVQMKPAVDWAQIKSNAQNKGNGDFVVSFDNNDGLARKATLVVQAGNNADTILFIQSGVQAVIDIKNENYTVLGGGAKTKKPLYTTVPLNLIDNKIEYKDAAAKDWISALSLIDGFLCFDVEKNTSNDTREATITLSYVDAFDKVISDILNVRQMPIGEASDATLVTYEYVRGLVPGEITEDIYIESYVISDKDNPNMGQNPNKNTTTVDNSVNDKTSYVQSLDGKYGFRILSVTADDNILNRYDKVFIWLKGTILKKESNPERYTIENIQVKNIISKEDGNPASVLPMKEMYMKDLTDNDIYTYVKLKDVEISVPTGSLVNINEGYRTRMDCYPLNIRDINGNSMYVLTNMGVTYRRTGEQVPQGSGTVSGIIVNENHGRYGGDIGKYSLRHLSVEDFNIAKERQNGFSNVLAEWSRYKVEFEASPTDAKNPLTPDIGSEVGAKMTHSNISVFGGESTGTNNDKIFKFVDFNGFTLPVADNGKVVNGSWGTNNWWNTSENKGYSWNIEVSTKNVNTPLSVQVEGSTSFMAPRNWLFEWADGANPNNWSLLSEFTFEDMTEWNNTLFTQVPGFKVLNFQLPQEASGLDKLLIRLRVKNNVTGTSTSDTGGTISNTRGVRLGHVSIKYNK